MANFAENLNAGLHNLLTPPVTPPAYVAPAVPNMSMMPTMSVPPTQKTSVVSSGTASNKATDIKNNIIAPHDQAVSSQKPSPTNDIRDENGLLMNPPGAMYDRNTGKLLNPPPEKKVEKPPSNPLEEAQTNEVLHPGQRQLFNIYTGESEWVDETLGVPNGFSKLDPKERTDVSKSVQDAQGNTIQKLSDGTYRRIDSNGNYSFGTAQMFNDAKRVKDLSDKLDNVRNGIYDENQKSQLSAIESDYNELISKQENLNANTTGATTIAMARSGLGNQILGNQQIDKTIRDGISAVADLVRKKNGAVSAMKVAFEEGDSRALKAAFDIYNTTAQNIQDQINKTQALVQSAKDKQDLKNQSNAITMGNKYLDTQEPILVTDTPEEVAAKVKTSPTWQAEQRQKSGQVDQEAVDGAYAIWLKTGALPAGFSSMAQNLKNALYKKIGGNPDSVDESVLNKARLTGVTKALSTQENQLAGAKTSISTLDKTLDLAQTYSNKVDRTGSPFAAKYANFLKGKVQGDADIAAFQALMKTAAGEYAKIMSGAASSISGATVSSVEDAQSIINAEMSKGQIDEVINILKKDAKFRVDSQEETITGLQNDIKNIGNSSSSSSSNSDPLGLGI